MTVPKKDFLVVQGDWNAKVGSDAHQNLAGTVGWFGIGKTNNRSQCLLEFARSHHLTLANILHPHKLSWTATWHSPNRQVCSLTDFILTLQCMNTRTFPGAEISCNHNLVLETFKLRLKARCCLKSPCIWCLTSRLQYVKLNGLLSTAIRTNTGAPQGTVLAPFLFALYTADCRSTDEHAL